MKASSPTGKGRMRPVGSFVCARSLRKAGIRMTLCIRGAQTCVLGVQFKARCSEQGGQLS